MSGIAAATEFWTRLILSATLVALLATAVPVMFGRRSGEHLANHAPLSQQDRQHEHGQST